MKDMNFPQIESEMPFHVEDSAPLIALRKDTAVLLCKIVVAEFDAVFILVAVQLINIDSH